MKNSSSKVTAIVESNEKSEGTRNQSPYLKSGRSEGKSSHVPTNNQTGTQNRSSPRNQSPHLNSNKNLREIKASKERRPSHVPATIIQSDGENKTSSKTQSPHLKSEKNSTGSKLKTGRRPSHVPTIVQTNDESENLNSNTTLENHCGGSKAFGANDGLFNFFTKPLDVGGISSINLTSSSYTLPTSPSIAVDLLKTRKTIINTFCISEKPEFNKESFKLYQDTIKNRADELFKSAQMSFEEEAYEKCLCFLQKATTMEPNSARIYLLRGETFLQLCDFQSAILNFKRVCILQPEDDECFSRLAFIYFLQGQCYYDEQLYLDALECFTRAAEMKPDMPGYHIRSIACLASLKKHKECLKLINERLEVESQNPDLFIMRARLHLLFCNPTLSYYDVKAALSLDPDDVEAGFMQTNLQTNAEHFKQRAIQLDMSGKTKEAIMKITQAIETNPAVTSYHILRAGMHRRNLDFNAAVDDLLLTMDKTGYDPTNELYTQSQYQLLLTFNDFAVDCFRKGYYEEAIVLLEKAIQGGKNNPILYINRGDCFYKLNHLHFAMLDYQQAEELDTNQLSHESICWRLSVVYNDLGIVEYNERNYPRAEEYLSLAISYNCKNAALYLSRARTRYIQEKLEEAKVDMISSLYLDRVNREMFSIFVRLFPSQTMDEVLATEFASLVKEALQSVIDEQYGGREKLIDGTMKQHSLLPSIKTRSTIDHKMNQCMKDKDFDVQIIKGRKKVNELVESIIQSRQNLNYSGPKLTNNNKQNAKIKSTSTPQKDNSLSSPLKDVISSGKGKKTGTVAFDL